MDRSNVAGPAALSALGIVLASVGIALLLTGITPYWAWAAPALAITGLALVGAGLLWLMLAQMGVVGQRRRRSRRDLTSQRLESPAPLPNRERLLLALQSLETETLTLIDLRREIHRLNTQQWSYVHRQETAEEIEATRRYRAAKRSLVQEAQGLPRELQVPVDQFCNTMEKYLVDEVYGTPGDRIIHDTINERVRLTVRQMDEIAAGSLEPETGHQRPYGPL